MKKHFYSLWFRVVIIFFWAMVTTALVMGVLLHLMRGTFLWNFFPFTGLGFLAVLAVACILLGTLISVAIAHHVMNPVSELTRAMQKVAAGDYTVKLESGRYIGELADLYHNFNQMVQELNRTETLHSDFISNVSHEFKTPLASISGYATLLQDDSLSEKERDEYIEIIIQSAKVWILFHFFKTLHRVRELIVSIGFYQVIQSAHAECFQGVFLAGGGEDNLASGKRSADLLGKSDACFVLHINIQEDKRIFCLVQGLKKSGFTCESMDLYVHLVLLTIIFKIFFKNLYIFD